MTKLRTEAEIIENWKGDIQIPLVSINCLAYNHEKYIEDTLVGFLIQKTLFPFEILIHDDASTDNTANIIRVYERKYPSIIKPIYQKENQWTIDSEGIRRAQYDRIKGKYLAWCEGDDYWTDSFKLQKQIGFLEANPEYALVATDVILVNSKGEVIPDSEMLTKQREYRKPDVTVFDLLNLNLVNTLTVCVRADIIKELAKESIEKELRYLVDKWYWLNIALNLKVKLFYEKTAAYRIHEESISRKKGYLKPRMDLIHFDTVQKIYRDPKFLTIHKPDRYILAKTYYRLLSSPHIKTNYKLTLVGYLFARPSMLFPFINYFFTLLANKFKKKQGICITNQDDD